MASQDPVQPDPVNPAGKNDNALNELPPSDEGPVTLGQWLSQNGVMLAIVLALLIFLFYKFDTAALFNIFKAFLGLSLVVFIHELGHLLAAKWCDVHVTSFSLGFGPAIPGCHFKWGETTYKLSLIPLGGYVQMVGQVDGDESSDTTSEEDPRSYRNKTVGQRMLIISAGVIMNVILAVICFVLVFRGPGKDRIAAVISEVDTSSPSFVEGIHSGSLVFEMNGQRDPTFEDLMFEVRGTLEGDTIRFVFKSDYGPLTTDIEPLQKKSENPMIGLRPSEIPQLRTKKFLPKLAVPASPQTPAAKALPALQPGDKILAIREAGTEKWHDLKPDPRFPDEGQKDYFDFLKHMQDLMEKPIELKVQHEDSGEAVVRVERSFGRSLGVRMGMGAITSIRKGSAAATQKLVAGRDGKIGDIIEKVEVADGKGKVRVWADNDLNPESLPHELRQHIASLPAGVEKHVKLYLLRSQTSTREEFEKVEATLKWDDTWRYDRFTLIYKDSPLPIPELGLAYQIKTTVAARTEEKLGEVDNPLEKGDWIKKVRFHYQDDDGQVEADRWIELFEKKDDKEREVPAWAYISSFLNAANSIVKIEVEVDRNKDGTKETKTFEIVPSQGRPIPARGFLFMQDIRNERAAHIFGAVGLGMRDTHRSIMNVFRNLRGLIVGRLPVDKNLGGPGRIGEMAYRIAGFDIWEFVFFLGLISINLAVVNFLPIPVLDGGHMVFLVYEKLRGKPASEGVRNYATYAGLAIILCLMGFVIFLDISHYLR